MGKWDKLSRRGVRGNRAFKLLFGEFVFFFFFFLHLLFLRKCKKRTCERKNRPLRRTGRRLFHRTVGGTYV